MKFWADNPSILFDSQYITEIWVYSNMDTNQKLNAISRLVILLSLIGYVCFNRYIIFILGLIILGVIVIIQKTGKKEKEKEGFTDVEEYQRITSNNPLQNLLLPEYKYKEPDRVAPKYDKKVEDNINQTAKNFILQENKDNADIGNIFSNLGDKFEFEQSMRPFYTNPVTSIGQTEYGDFLGYLFGSLPSDKPLKKY